jgi:hypothetical protein
MWRLLLEIILQGVMIAILVMWGSETGPGRARRSVVYAGQWHVKRCQQERYDVDSTLVKIMELFLNFKMIGTNAVGEELTGRVGGECVGSCPIWIRRGLTGFRWLRIGWEV